MDSLINQESRTWNLQAIMALVDPHDVKIIGSIPLSRNQMEDRNGWHFTNNGKYSVQSGYQVERVYPDKEKLPVFYGPTVDTLKVFCWQLLSECIAIMKNLKSRWIQGDICCARCGDPEESINHVFFECPPARQVWALSKIPSHPNIFPISSFLLIWIIFFGELIQRWMTTNLHGYYGIYGKAGITKFLAIWILIRGKHSN